MYIVVFVNNATPYKPRNL